MRRSVFLPAFVFLLSLLFVTGCTDTSARVSINAPSYSLNQGSYASAQKVAINAPEGDNIVVYYTIDGSDPTDKSSKYDGNAISLETTTTVKSIAIDKNGNTSEIATASYNIDNSTAANDSTTTDTSNIDEVTGSTDEFIGSTDGSSTTSTDPNKTYTYIGDISGVWRNDEYGSEFYLDPKGGTYQFKHGTDTSYGNAEYVYGDAYHPQVELNLTTLGGNIHYYDPLLIQTGAKDDGKIWIGGAEYYYAGSGPIF
ncbi:MAG: chitobiase/beta-hexosaminidase C-terminal domain-containing protein [Eubacteriaceae bacterium]|jgi:hypothetical protein